MTNKDINVPINDCVSRAAAIEALSRCQTYLFDTRDTDRKISLEDAEYVIEKLPSAQPEPLTDKEQRIFRAAMEREEKVCEEVDRDYVREPYENSLMRVCKEIRRKVKGALWT